METEEALKLRSFGRSLIDRGLFENDPEDGRIKWVNDFILDKTGWSLSEIQEKTVFDLLPDQYHPGFRERTAGKRSKFYIFPIRTKNSWLTWWLTRDYDDSGESSWGLGKYMSTTKENGADFDVMHTIMESINLAGEVLFQHEDSHLWTKKELSRLDTVDASLRREFGHVSNKAGYAEQLARDAANQSLSMNETLKNFKGQISGFEQEIRDALVKMGGLEERVTEGIVRLMNTDQFYTRQAAAVRGLTKNIVISVSAIVIIGTIIQILIFHWSTIIKIIS
ncbi:MAG TPA: PAS domain-containing protein [Methylobacter sp.]|jgi:hypothetical protein